MPTCDEDDCTKDAEASCRACGLQLCIQHGGGDENECECGGFMEAL